MSLPAAATSMKWIKAKMEELGVMANENYKLCFMIDSLAMITVDTGPKYGVIEVNKHKQINGFRAKPDKCQFGRHF